MTFPIVKNPYNIKDSELGNGETQDDKEFNEQSIRLLKLSKGDRPYGLLWMQENELDLKVYHSDILTLDVWKGTEFPCKQLDTWEQIWRNYYGHWQEEKLKSVFSDGPITVYRGGPAKGYSWTTNIEFAKWFANIRGSMSWLRTEETGITVDIGVWKKTVSKKDVVAMLYEEDEVILTEECAFNVEPELVERYSGFRERIGEKQ